MKEHWCFFCFFYTKFHVQALKSTLIGTYEIYSLSYRTFKKMFLESINATLNHGNCSEMLVAPVLCELESVQALEMPAEVLEPHVAGPQSPDVDRTLKQ